MIVRRLDVTVMIPLNGRHGARQRAEYPSQHAITGKPPAPRRRSGYRFKAHRNEGCQARRQFYLFDRVDGADFGMIQS